METLSIPVIIKLIAEFKHHLSVLVSLKEKSEQATYLYDNDLHNGICYYLCNQHNVDTYFRNGRIFNKYKNNYSYIGCNSVEYSENFIDAIQLRIEVLSEILVNNELILEGY